MFELDRADGLYPWNYRVGSARADSRELPMATNMSRQTSRAWRVTALAAWYSRQAPRSEARSRAGSPVAHCTDRPSKTRCRDGHERHRLNVLSGWRGNNRCGCLVVRRPRLQRGSHGDRGESEHIAATIIAR